MEQPVEVLAPATAQKRKHGQWTYEVKRLVLMKHREGENWQETDQDFNIPHRNIYRWSNMTCDDARVPESRVLFKAN